MVYGLTGLHVLFFPVISANKSKYLCTCKSAGVGESQMLEEAQLIEIPRDREVLLCYNAEASGRV